MTCEYFFEDGACVPKRVHTVVVSVQHSDKIELETLRAEIMEKVKLWYIIILLNY